MKKKKEVLCLLPLCKGFLALLCKGVPSPAPMWFKATWGSHMDGQT